MKRSSFGGKAPRGILTEKRQRTGHRHYANISNNIHNGLNMNFSLKVANHILQQSLTTNTKNNVICSPLSIDAVLNLIALGASGATLEQLLELTDRSGVHDFNEMAAKLVEVVKDSKGEEGAEICFANSLWVDQRYSLKASFQEVLEESHKGHARVVDFHNKVDEVVEEVNSWAEKQSRGFIKQIITNTTISKATSMLLVNGLYFKGTWVDKFKRKYTKDEDFHLLNGTKIRLPFMNTYYEHFDYGIFEDCQVLRMLYEEEEDVRDKKKDDVADKEEDDDDVTSDDEEEVTTDEEEDDDVNKKAARGFSMYIFLPQEKDGLPKLLETIQMDSNLFMDKIKLEHKKIDKLSLPKFEFECDLQLTKPMKELGLTLPFDEKCKDLTGIVECSSTKDWIYVTDIIQKCRIEIDEDGTKAAVFTRVPLLVGAARPRTPPPPINFVADHPFLFMIREDITGAILFVGTVLHP